MIDKLENFPKGLIDIAIEDKSKSCSKQALTIKKINNKQDL